MANFNMQTLYMQEAYLMLVSPRTFLQCSWSESFIGDFQYELRAKIR